MKFLFSLILFMSVPAFASNGLAVSSYIDYSSTPVTTSQVVNMFAGVAQAAARMTVFDSSGLPMQIIITSPGGVVSTIVVPPGGADYTTNIQAGSYVQLKAKTSTASLGLNITTLTYFQ